MTQYTGTRDYNRTRRLEETATWAIDKFESKKAIREWLARYEATHGSCVELHRILKARFGHSK